MFFIRGNSARAVHPKIKHMIYVMAQKQAQGPKPKRRSSRKPWFLYIVKCRNGALYTGVTNDVDRRIRMHNNGRGSRYTRANRPVELVYQEPCIDKIAALVRECAVKALSKPQKEKLATTYSLPEERK